MSRTGNLNSSALSLVVDNGSSKSGSSSVRNSVSNSVSHRKSTKEATPYFITLHIECFLYSTSLNQASTEIHDRLYKKTNQIRDLVDSDFSYYVIHTKKINGIEDLYCVESRVEWKKESLNVDLIDIIQEIESNRMSLEELLSCHMSYEVKQPK